MTKSQYKRLSLLNTKLLRTNNNIFNGAIQQHTLSVREWHLFNCKERVKSGIAKIKKIVK